MPLPVTARTRYRSRRAAGFTLMEMVIVVVIVGILASLALPLYRESVRKGKRADAKAGLMSVSNRQESLMLDRKTYTIDMEELGFINDPPITNDPMITEEGHYQVNATSCTDADDEYTDADGAIATCYVLTATPVANDPQEQDDRCAIFIQDSTGAKRAQNAKGIENNEECW